MPDIRTLLNQMSRSGDVARIARNPLAQFGVAARPYLGTRFLPERPVNDNAYTEEGIRYRSIIANAGTRYSPTQKKGGAIVGTVDVKLFESDIASELTSRDYDALVRYARANNTMAAMASATRFLDTTVNVPLVEFNERMRWQAIVDSQVVLVGDNDYREVVAYANPAGSRVNITPGSWDDPLYDPMLDIFGRVQYLADKGYTVNAIATSRRVVGKLAKHPKVAARANRIVVTTGGQIQGVAGRVTLADINGILTAEGLPAMEVYDLQYRTMTGTGRFLRNNVMVFFGMTGRDEALDLGDTMEIIPDTLGYVGVGRPAGQATSGRVIRQEVKENKPPRVEAEGWQTSAAVITEPDAITTLDQI